MQKAICLKGATGRSFRQPDGVGDPLHASMFNVRNLRDPDAISIVILTRTNCESETRKTMIVGIRKSDKIAVPEKQANNAFLESSGVCGGKGLD
jgi:hypothetical protein